MKDLLKFALPGKPEYVQCVKLAVGSAAGTMGFNVEAIDDIQTAIAEACRNITCHGFQGYSAYYEVTCELQDDRMILNVADIGNDHSLEKHNKPCLDCPHEGDLAVHIIKSLMDQVEINKACDTNCKSIRMVKNK